MAPHESDQDWEGMLNRLEELKRSWLLKADRPAGKTSVWLEGVRFGITIGLNALAEEVAKPNPDVSALMAEWVQILGSKQLGPGQDAMWGIDHGIELVVESVCRFLNIQPPRRPPGSVPDAVNGDQEEEAS